MFNIVLKHKEIEIEERIVVSRAKAVGQIRGPRTYHDTHVKRYDQTHQGEVKIIGSNRGTKESLGPMEDIVIKEDMDSKDNNGRVKKLLPTHVLSR